MSGFMSEMSGRCRVENHNPTSLTQLSQFAADFGREAAHDRRNRLIWWD
jgi:hypothetical protein